MHKHKASALLSVLILTLILLLSGCSGDGTTSDTNDDTTAPATELLTVFENVQHSIR